MNKSQKITKRCAVVGSGFGGLAVAIRLAASGAKVVLFEARDKPGGRAYVYKDKGFTFDAGPTVITAPQCLEEVFAAADRRLEDYVELLPVTPFYRLLWEDGHALDYDGDLSSVVAEKYPADKDGYERFVSYAKRVFEAGYEDLAAQPFLRFSDMVRVAPQLAKLRADRSVYKTVSKYVDDEHLRQALSFHSLLVGGNPFSTSSIYTLIHYLERKWGVFFPRGGTGALIAAMVTLFEELGGELRLSCPVERIVPESGGHRVDSSHETGEQFDVVVSNADIHHTYKTLLKDEPLAAKMTRKLERLEWSMSLFVLYFGTKVSYADTVAHHTVLFGPRYRDLLAEIFKGDHLPKDFSLYLHAPTISDPSLAPPGCGGFYVLAPVPHLGRAAIDWDAEAPRYADSILEYLEKIMPGLRENVVTKRWFTPNDFVSELNAHQGSAFSCAPLLTQSAWFRPHNKDPRIDGLYFVGAGTHPGAGVPGVVNSAKGTFSLIAKDYAE